jgi:hypothetical protein
MSGKAPAIGDWVTYTLSEDDAHLIASRRMAVPDSAKGNSVAAGDTFPAIIVRAWDDGAVNLQVLLDGYDQHWATSIRPAEDDGQHGAYSAS